jgi:DNA-binding transcriptional LysR family regulator
MELYQLRSFVAIAELGQLTRAAEKLHVSQPAVSAQLKALEDKLGLVLFERTASGMVLTAPGARLLAEAEKVLAAARDMQNVALSFKGELAGKASIGTLSDPHLTRIGEFMNVALARHPLLELELHQGVTGTALDQVRDGVLDASFYYGELRHPNVVGLPLRRLVFRVVAPAAWKDRLRLSGWEQVAAMPWIIPPPISSHHQLAHALLQEHGVTPGRVVEADQEAVIASLVVSGVGMALMREEVAFEKAAAGEICIWNDEQIDSMLWFVTQRQRENDPIIHALIDLQRELWALTDRVGQAPSAAIYRNLNPASRDSAAAQPSPPRT